MALTGNQVDPLENENELELNEGEPTLLNTENTAELNNLGRGDGDSAWVPAKKIKTDLANKFNNIIKVYAKRNTTMMFKTHGTGTGNDKNSISLTVSTADQNLERCGPWHFWTNTGIFQPDQHQVPLRMIADFCPMFCSKQGRMWELYDNTAPTTDDGKSYGYERWAFYNGWGKLSKNMLTAASQASGGAEFQFMRIGNFKIKGMPYQNQAISSTPAGTPALAPTTRMIMAWKYIESSKYDLVAGQGETGKSLTPEAVSYNKAGQDAVLQPIHGQAAAKELAIGSGTREMTLDVEWIRKFTSVADNHTFEEWKHGSWTPWFKYDANFKVRTSPIIMQMMAYRSTLGQKLRNGTLATDANECSLHNGAKTAGGSDEPAYATWLAVYEQNVIHLPIQITYDIEFRGRLESGYF